MNQFTDETGARVFDEIAKHQRKMRALTGLACTFGILAVVASILIIAGYLVLYLPKQKQLMQDFGARIERIDSTATLPPGAQSPSPRDRYDFPHIQVIMMNAVSFGGMLVAVAVGLLAAGTLTVLALIVVSRRATLDQINASLRQITEQMKLLQNARP
ncbi:MAG: hypothetical protein JWM99_2652 [Verrucomicrobiales bacterium]|nr:hypothetical protein [Verrucomicrobiales bacterium]